MNEDLNSHKLHLQQCLDIVEDHLLILPELLPKFDSRKPITRRPRDEHERLIGEVAHFGVLSSSTNTRRTMNKRTQQVEKGGRDGRGAYSDVRISQDIEDPLIRQLDP